MAMNYIRHLTGFFDRVTKDGTLNPTHISLYMALFQFWNCARFRNPISISRDEVMRISKISSKATYHKCLRALHAQGYIRYEPSYNPFKGSQVYLFDFTEDTRPASKKDKEAGSIFNPANGQAVNRWCTGYETSAEQVVGQAVVSYINNTNKTNSLNNSNLVNLKKQAKKKEDENNANLKHKKEKEKSSAKKEMFSTDAGTDENQIESSSQKSAAKKVKDSGSEFPPSIADSTWVRQEQLPGPSLEGVQAYFRQRQFPELEAAKFFNYFQSNGWLVGGRTPMADWQAAAQNWMLNAPKFESYGKTEATRSFDTSTGKDYSEPL